MPACPLQPRRPAPLPSQHPRSATQATCPEARAGPRRRRQQALHAWLPPLQPPRKHSALAAGRGPACSACRLMGVNHKRVAA